MANETNKIAPYKGKYDEGFMNKYGIIIVTADCPECDKEIQIRVDIRGTIEAALNEYLSAHPIPVLENTVFEYDPIPSSTTIAGALNNLADKVDTIINIIKDDKAKKEEEVEDFNNFDNLFANSRD